MFKFLVVLACIYWVPGAFSDCTQRMLSPQPEFDFNKVAGSWFMQYRSTDEKTADPDYKCMRHYYTVHGDGTMELVEATLHSTGTKKSEGSSFFSDVHHKSTNGAASIDYFDGKEDKLELDYNFVSSDYTSYLITAFCSDEYHGTYIFSRKKTVDPEFIKSVEAALEPHKKTFTSDFVPANQQHCP